MEQFSVPWTFFCSGVLFNRDWTCSVEQSEHTFEHTLNFVHCHERIVSKQIALYGPILLSTVYMKCAVRKLPYVPAMFNFYSMKRLLCNLFGT